MANTLTIRPLRLEDKPQWLTLWAGYNAFYKRTAAITPPITDATFARFFDSYEPMHATVAEQNGALLGFVHYIYHRNTAMIAPVCYLQDLFTAEAARGKGVGRALIEAVYDAARQAGSPRVYWHTHETNATARLLYDRIAENSGFIQYRKVL